MSDTKSKAKTFFYHYNKPASSSKGYPVISIHYAGSCHMVKNLIVKVPTKGRIRSKQPKFVVTGFCRSLTIDTDGVATLA